MKDLEALGMLQPSQSAAAVEPTDLAHVKHPTVTAHLTEAWKEETLRDVLPHHGSHLTNDLQ